MPWNTFSNTDPTNFPDGVKMMENWDYRYQTGTLAEFKANALLYPTIMFHGRDTESRTVYLYTGDATLGDDGFIVVGGGEW